MRVLNIYRKDSRNVGDLKTSPLLYFKFSADQDSLDVLEAGKDSDLSNYDAIIVGGGGLLQDKWFMSSLTRIRNSCRGKVILWGAGLNNHFYDETIYFAPSFATRRRLFFEGLLGKRSLKVAPSPRSNGISSQCNDWLRTCDLIGVRDYGTGFDWVPCASCMDARLDYYRNMAPKHPLVAIDHPDFCRIELSHVPHFSNVENDFDSILSFIASGETVLSASYHAAYWALLMGRKVVVVPWSEKFSRLKYDVPACLNRGELPNCVARARPYPEALKECRDRNIDFVSEVSKLLGLSWTQIND
jgi:hypothetical protein